MANFWETARRIAISDSEGTYRSLFDTVNRAASTLRRCYARINTNFNNLEELYSCLELAECAAVAADFSFDQFATAKRSLIQLIARTLDESQTHITNWSSGELYGAGPEGYKALADFCYKLLHSESSYCIDFITFNYDIGLELALHSHGIDYTYCHEFTRLAPAHDGRTSRVCKLHGSVNWASGDPDVTTFHGKMFVPKHAMEAEHPHRTGEGVELKFSSARALLQYGGTTIPFIVPPSDSKSERRKTLLPIWQQAISAIQAAEIVVIAGYSMPSSDSFFRQLMSIGSITDTDLRRLYIINPDRLACNRIGELFTGNALRSRELLCDGLGFVDGIDRISKFAQNECDYKFW